MPTYRIDDEGKFVNFEQKKAQDLETRLEEALEHNDHVVLAPERVLFVGRQVATDLNKAVDLLAVDRRRRLVVVELKKDRTPREMVAQALEYAAFVRHLSYDALNGMAVPYFSRRNQPWGSLLEAHREFFGDSGEGVDDGSTADEWNQSQIVVLVGQTIAPDIMSVSRYLRDHDLDIRVLQLVYFESLTGERLVNTQIVVGDEPLPSEASSTATQGLTLQQIVAKVPETQPVLARLQKGFEEIGLLPRAAKASISFDRARGEPLLNMWPSQGGYVIVWFYGNRASQLGNLDRFQAAVESIGLEVRRGRSDLTVHVQPSDLERVPRLATTVKEHFLGARAAVGDAGGPST
jgi:hypothetical protein